MNTELAQTRGASLGPVLVAGFAATLTMACTWFVTHLPWLKMPEPVAIALILGAWVLALAWGATMLRKSRALSVGLGAGFVSGLTGLVFFGSKLAEAANAEGVSAGTVPNAWLLAVGFVVLGLALGLVGGLVGRVMARTYSPDQGSAHWLARFALVACAAIAPLVFIGGLVTSTNSGMAFPDWPRSYGANMFLYPLGSHTPPDKFVEHAHRLFGAYAGLTVLVLMVFTLKVETRKWVWALAVVAFVLVCVQGVLGGQRVAVETALSGGDLDKAKRVGRFLALAHGILAQLTFATLVGLAVVVSDHFRALAPGPLLEAAMARRVRLLCTAAMHTLILQLIFGAIYRHFRGNHALWTHIGFSVIVSVLAIVAGFTLASESVRRTLGGRVVANIGLAMGCAVGLQFFLGWLAFAFAGREPSAADMLQAVIRTAHQANGALLMAVATAAFVWGKRLGRVQRA